jgi:hypothetical protein
VTIIRDTLLRAIFVRDSFNLTITANPTAGGTLLPAGTNKYPCGELAMISVIENECYVFDG